MSKEPFEFTTPEFKKLHTYLIQGKTCVTEVTPKECGVLWAGIPQEEVDEMIEEINTDKSRRYAVNGN